MFVVNTCFFSSVTAHIVSCFWFYVCTCCHENFLYPWLHTLSCFWFYICICAMKTFCICVFSEQFLHLWQRYCVHCFQFCVLVIKFCTCNCRHCVLLPLISYLSFHWECSLPVDGHTVFVAFIFIIVYFRYISSASVTVTFDFLHVCVFSEHVLHLQLLTLYLLHSFLSLFIFSTSVLHL